MHYESNPEYKALVAEIASRPDDDLPRLVAADWIEERGDGQRAAFIRTQVELRDYKALGCFSGERCRSEGDEQQRDPHCAHCRENRRHELRLIRSFPPEWATRVAAVCGSGFEASERMWFDAQYLVSLYHDDDHFADLYFRRGFVEKVSARSDLWPAIGPYLVERQPIQTGEFIGREPSNSLTLERGGESFWVKHPLIGFQHDESPSLPFPVCEYLTDFDSIRPVPNDPDAAVYVYRLGSGCPAASDAALMWAAAAAKGNTQAPELAC
jgi:uncharacterized protein (TIGR02996 family)